MTSNFQASFPAAGKLSTSLLNPRRSTTPYLLLIATAIIGGNLLEYVFHGEPFFKGQSLGLISSFILGLCAALAWLITPGLRSVSRLAQLAFLLLLGLWALALGRAVFEGTAFNYSAVLTPVFILMIVFKTPDIRESRVFGDFVAVSLASVAVATQVLDWTGLRAFRTDIASRWDLPIPWLDIPARWEGMFGDPNNAGFIGAFLIIYGLRRKGLLRTYVVVVGALVLIMSQSRTAILAALVGITVLTFASNWYQRRQFKPVMTAGLIAGISCMALIIVLAIDPTFNGRVPIWRAALSLVPRDLIFGIGSHGIGEASVAGEIPWSNTDAHSILIDSLVRDGILTFVCACALIVTSLLLASRVRKLDQGVSLAVICTFIAASITYTTTSWIYLNVQVLPLLVALLMSNAICLGRAWTHSA